MLEMLASFMHLVPIAVAGAYHEAMLPMALD
jgi:hypothetical protein